MSRAGTGPEAGAEEDVLGDVEAKLIDGGASW